MRRRLSVTPSPRSSRWRERITDTTCASSLCLLLTRIQVNDDFIVDEIHVKGRHRKDCR
jgi:hypothetical protein